jgi:ABC-type polysaccharide/polyol phosphate transport system ATPase subunit
MPTAVEANGISKRYRLGVDAGYDTLRDAVRRRFHRPVRRSEIWALKNVSFVVEQGEALGIIGANGAGKTTLLKILAGITEPTAGEARTRGRVGALLDVGTGFHPELTGRENVYLNGATLGMSRAEVGRRFDAIVEFAGVERFLDTPVKRYSAGMRLRLAFAVAAHIEPPIVVVDEVLAVGDAAFQEKCLGKVSEIGRHGRTVLFVSHDLGAVTRICPRAIWLERGRLRQDGLAPEVVSAYLGTTDRAPLVAELEHDPSVPVGLTRAAIRDGDGRVVSAPLRGESFVIELLFSVGEQIPDLDVGISLTNERGVRVIHDFCADWEPESGLLEQPGHYKAQVTLPGLLPPGSYVVEAEISDEHEVFVRQEVLTLKIAPRADDRHEWINRPRAALPQLKWQVLRESRDD